MHKGWSAHCSAHNCTNNADNRPDLSFFSFPNKKERCAEWVRRSGRLDLTTKSPSYLHTTHKLCSEHFEKSQLMRRKRPYLIKDAVPMLRDDDDEGDDDSPMTTDSPPPPQASPQDSSPQADSSQPTTAPEQSSPPRESSPQDSSSPLPTTTASQVTTTTSQVTTSQPTSSSQPTSTSPQTTSQPTSSSSQPRSSQPTSQPTSSQPTSTPQTIIPEPITTLQPPPSSPPTTSPPTTSPQPPPSSPESHPHNPAAPTNTNTAVNEDKPNETGQQKEASEETPKTKVKKVQLPKRPKAPIRPSTPYMAFTKEMWGRVSAENENFKSLDVAKMILKMWEELSVAKKKNYVNEYEVKKAEHDKEMEAYLNSSAYLKYIEAKNKANPPKKQPTSSSADKKTKPKRTRGPPKPKPPKKPLIPHISYHTKVWLQVKAENPDMNLVQLSELIKSKWRKMPWSERAPYVYEYKEKMAQYKTAMQVYLSSPAYLEYLGAHNKAYSSSLPESDDELSDEEDWGVEVVQVIEKDKLTDDPNIPSHPDTPFMKYSTMMREQVKETHSHLMESQLNKLIRAKWSRLSKEARKTHLEEYEAEMAEYEDEIEEYNDSTSTSNPQSAKPVTSKPLASFVTSKASFHSSLSAKPLASKPLNHSSIYAKSVTSKSLVPPPVPAKPLPVYSTSVCGSLVPPVYGTPVCGSLVPPPVYSAPVCGSLVPPSLAATSINSLPVSQQVYVTPVVNNLPSIAINRLPAAPLFYALPGTNRLSTSVPQRVLTQHGPIRETSIGIHPLPVPSTIPNCGPSILPSPSVNPPSVLPAVQNSRDRTSKRKRGENEPSNEPVEPETVPGNEPSRLVQVAEVLRKQNVLFDRTVKMLVQTGQQKQEQWFKMQQEQQKVWLEMQQQQFRQMAQLQQQTTQVLQSQIQQQACLVRLVTQMSGGEKTCPDSQNSNSV